MALTQNESQHKQWRLFANTVRQDIVKMVTAAESGHPGGPLGLADIYSVLYNKYLKHYATQPRHPDRDRFILSNGHCCAVVYSVIARLGGFAVDDLATFRRLGSKLHGHPSPMYFPWIENAGGSLGQGLSFAVGTALAGKLDNAKWRVFVGMSDGECQEGMTWEAAMSAVHHKIDNLIAFVDYNRIQIDGHTDDVMSLGDLAAKFKSFGWAVDQADGHDVEAIDQAFAWAVQPKGVPAVILFNTVLGKGVSYMENNPKWHGSPPSPAECEKALAELTAFRATIA